MLTFILKKINCVITYKISDNLPSSRRGIKLPLKLTCILFLLIPVSISNACGPQPLGFHSYTFLNQNILEKKEGELEVPVVGTFDQFYGGFFQKMIR